MIATQVEISNFRSFCPTPVKVSLTPVTAIVGENNVGKSNVILALDLFRNFKKSKIRKKDFHNNDDKEEITIKLTFGQLTADEQKLFRRHLSPDNTLAVTQTIKVAGAANSRRSSSPSPAASARRSIAGTGFPCLNSLSSLVASLCPRN